MILDLFVGINTDQNKNLKEIFSSEVRDFSYKFVNQFEQEEVLLTQHDLQI